jgi:hypothetical protein
MPIDNLLFNIEIFSHTISTMTNRLIHEVSYQSNLIGILVYLPDVFISF